jgi:hypothetical protein
MAEGARAGFLQIKVLHIKVAQMQEPRRRPFGDPVYVRFSL